MTVLVVGATTRALERLTDAAPAGMRVIAGAASPPDWILVANGAQRAEAIATYGLTPYRVVEIPSLGADEELPASVRATLATMAGIGPSRPLISAMGVAMVRPFVRRRVERAEATLPIVLAPDLPETGMLVSGVPPRMPAGARLTSHLAIRARDRAARFAALAVRWTDDRSS